MSLVKYLLAVWCCCAAGISLIAQPAVASPQTPRQAIVEMFSGSQEKFNKHLTLEVQEKLRHSVGIAAMDVSQPWQMLLGGKTIEGRKVDAFDSGEILLSLNDSTRNQRFELHCVSDEQRGDQDVMDLSLHSYRAGTEEQLPLALNLQLVMRLQEGIWRLNDVTLSVKLPVGDPGVLDSWWNAPSFSSSSAPAALPVAEPASMSAQITPFRAVRRITLAESLFAKKHPETGYTCDIQKLINIGRGLDESGLYQFMQPDFADGLYGGYRYELKGCEGKPARKFQVVAEPANGKGKAYCSDDRHNLRTSEDGVGLNCLADGKVALQ